VTPLLKLQILSDPKEWRNRLVNTKSHQQTVASLAPETYTMLDRLSEDMERTLQAVKKSEQKLNQQCKEQVDDFALKQDSLTQVQNEYNAKSEAIAELTNALQQVSDELASIKGRMDERGNSMTDTSPLIKIKSALQRLKEERKAMEIRIGVVTHTLVAKKLKSDQHTKKEAARPKNAMQNESYAEDDDELED
jgi:estrogen-related receptor beta like 1